MLDHRICDKETYLGNFDYNNDAIARTIEIMSGQKVTDQERIQLLLQQQLNQIEF